MFNGEVVFTAICGLDGIGIGMVIIGRRKYKSTFGAYKFVLLESYLDASTVQE